MADSTEWAVVELMGHVRLAGRLSEVERFGTKMARLDVPTQEPCGCPNPAEPTVECCRCHGLGVVHSFATKFFGGQSVYCVTVVTEEVARIAARQSSDVAPVQPWHLPRALAARNVLNDDEY